MFTDGPVGIGPGMRAEAQIVEFSFEAGAAAPMRQIADFADAAPQPRKKQKGRWPTQTSYHYLKILHKEL